MMEWIASLPLGWAILFFWCLAAARATTTFALGRGIAAGARHTALNRYLSGPVYDRAMSFVDRWGPWAIPLCFLTVGIQTAVIGSAGIARMAWRRFIPAMLLGSLIWGVIYGTVGMAVVWAVLFAVVSAPWTIPALVGIAVGIFVLAWWRTGGFARLRASRAQRRAGEAAGPAGAETTTTAHPAAPMPARDIGQEAGPDSTSDVGR